MEATCIYCVCIAHKQRGGRPSASVTFGKYGFTLTERKLSPHEQKLRPLAIRRGGGRWVTVWGRWLISASLVWLCKLLLRLGPFVILLYYRTLAAKQFLIPAVTLGKAQNLRLARDICFTSVQFGGFVVTNWIFLATQRDQKENEDWGQNMVDFQSEICQTFD